MKEVRIRLSTTKQVQRFVSDLVPLKGDFELVSDHQLLDARSLMGIFGFDLTQPIRLRVYNESPENMAAIEPYRADREEMNDEQ